MQNKEIVPWFYDNRKPRNGQWHSLKVTLKTPESLTWCRRYVAIILVVSLNSSVYFDFLPNQLLNKPPVSLSSTNFSMVAGSCFIIELIADDLEMWI